MMQPGDQLERYRIEVVLGRGATATVYRARHSTLGSLHAVKVLETTSASMRERTLNEGRALSRLRHRNVVGVTDALAVGDRPALVMEFVDGPDLARFLAARPLDDAQIDTIARDLFAGIGAAHAAGLVHRDLKPANILLDLSTGAPVARVADFGLVKDTVGPSATRTGSTLGTPAYMSPEQLRDPKSVDARADLWSLGCILYEMIAGKRPFDGEDGFRILEDVAYGRFPPLDEVAPRAPERMRKAVAAALVVDREGRCASIAALQEVWGSADSEPTWDLEVFRLPAEVASATTLTLDPSLGGAPAVTFADPLPAAATFGFVQLPADPLDTDVLLGAPPAPFPVPPEAVDARPIAAVGLAGLLAGVAASIALVPAWFYVLIAGYAGQSGWPSWVALPAYASAALVIVAGGWLGALRWRPAAAAGAWTGAVAGLIVHMAVGWPVFALLAANPVWDLAQRDESTVARVLAGVAGTTFLLEYAGAIGLMVAGAALGALGGAIGAGRRASEPDPLDVRATGVIPKAAFGTALLGSFSLAIVMAGTDELFGRAVTGARGDVGGVVVAQLAAWVVGAGAPVAVAAVGALAWAFAVPWVHSRTRGPVRSAVGATGAVLVALGLAFVAADRPWPMPLAVGGTAALLISIAAPLLAHRAARGVKPLTVGVPSAGESLATGLVSGQLTLLVLGAGAMVPGQAASTVMVALIGWLSQKEGAKTPQEVAAALPAVATSIAVALLVLLMLAAGLPAAVGAIRGRLARR